MLISYNADLLPKVRMLGQIRYNEPWIHFSRCINEWVLYVIRDGNLYLQEDGIRYHLSAGDFFLLEPGLPHEGYQKMRGMSYQEVLRTNGQISFPEVLRQQKRL